MSQDGPLPTKFFQSGDDPSTKTAFGKYADGVNATDACIIWPARIARPLPRCGDLQSYVKQTSNFGIVIHRVVLL
jgi:hypothetical protein